MFSYYLRKNEAFMLSAIHNEIDLGAAIHARDDMRLRLCPRGAELTEDQLFTEPRFIQAGAVCTFLQFPFLSPWMFHPVAFSWSS